MTNQEPNKIVVRNVFKIFGNRSVEALEMVRQNNSKDEVTAKPAAWSA